MIKPFAGAGQIVPSEAAVLQPLLERGAGLAMAQVFLTEYGDIDTYAMVAAEMDEGLRRIAAVGGDPEQIGGMDNFCWPSIQYDAKTNPDGKYKAAQLVRACWALRDGCLTAGIPLLSGKDLHVRRRHDPRRKRPAAAHLRPADHDVHGHRAGA